MTLMLASVESLEEALQVMEAGADIVDLKSPAEGALGALPVDAVGAIVAAVGGRRPVSATVGDLPLDPSTMPPAARAMAGAGVDFVKIGFFPGGEPELTLPALGRLAESGIRLVAVLFADLNPDLSIVSQLAANGFAGVMLDTMDKRGGSLTQVLAADRVGEFVAESRTQGLLCGLAGSLRARDVPELLPLAPDYLGFRGALCEGNQRINRLDFQAAANIARLIHLDRG